MTFAYLIFTIDPALGLYIFCFSFTFQTAPNTSEVRQDSSLADIGEMPHPKRYGKHSCYATFTNLRNIKWKYLQSEETRKNSRDQGCYG